MEYTEEKIDIEKHFRIVGDFCCGADDPLNSFLTDKSFDYDENKLGVTYLIFNKDKSTLLGFYTIKTNAIQTIDDDTGEYNALPMIEIARIAVQHEFQSNGIGRRIFFDYIFPKVKQVGSLVAVYGLMVFVDPYNEKGIKFYESIGLKKADSSIQKMIGETFNEKCDLYVASI